MMQTPALDELERGERERQQRRGNGADEPIPEQRPWPAPLDERAYHGIAGRLVRTVEPHTEADPSAVLVQFLVVAGNAIGRGPYYVIEATKHRTNEFALIVGDTSRARKGTSFDRVRRPLELIEGESWAGERIMSGLSSGEGLIWQDRDPIHRRDAVKEKGRVVDYEDVEVDAGISDKRLLVVESEFASTLRVASRDGSTLSPLLRLAWDRGDLAMLTKTTPARATGAHVSIIGHITEEELRRDLDETNVANGFANRFLIVCARRSQKLPHGGSLEDGDLHEIARDLAAIFAWAGNHERNFRLSRTAKETWEKLYSRLTEPAPGLLGAVIARAEAHVIRLSLIYAALDRSEEIALEHLAAATAVWTYCEASVRYLFGQRLGDPVADAILDALKRSGAAGMSRNEIRDLFSRNVSSGRMGRALSELLRLRLVTMRKAEPDGPGRPEERWFAVGRTYAENAENAEMRGE
jgi:hypothetical protein